MRRREFIALIGGSTMLPIAARTQQPATTVIGYFSGRSADAEAPIREPLLRSLEQSGFAVGHNIAIEYRFAEGRPERVPILAAELVRRGVAILIATDGGSALAAAGTTATIPIVFTIGFDPEFEHHIALVDTAHNHTLLQGRLADLGHRDVRIKFIKAEAPAGRAATPPPPAAVVAAAAPVETRTPAPTAKTRIR